MNGATNSVTIVGNRPGIRSVRFKLSKNSISNGVSAGTSIELGPMRKRLSVATYNVHRWTGRNGRSPPDPAQAGFVISELRADVIALQEVLRPNRGEDPLEAIAEIQEATDGIPVHEDVLVIEITMQHATGAIG